MASICWHMHLACVLPVLWSSFMCHGSAVYCGINLKQWRDSEKFIIQRNHKKTTLPLLSSPLPPPLFIHRKERYCFPSNPPPHQTLSHTRANACTVHIRDWAEPLSDPAGVRTGGKNGGGWSTPHSLYPWQHRHQTKPPPTVAVPPKQRHLCALVCFNKERGQIQRWSVV